MSDNQTTVRDLDRDQLCRAFLHYIQSDNDCHLAERDGKVCNANHPCGCWLELLIWYKDAAESNDG